MTYTVNLAEIKVLLRHSTDLNPEPESLGAHSDTSPVPTHPEPYELHPEDTRRAVRAIVKDGIQMVVKFGVDVYAREAEAMTYVASHTSIPIPRLYRVFTEAIADSNKTVTYIVQEQVPGTRLEHAFESLSAFERDAVARQLKDIFLQLHSLADGQTRLEPFGGGSWARTLWFKCFQNDFPMRDDDAHTTRALLTYFLGITSRRYRPGGAWKLDEFLALFDLDRAPVFSHGDLTPWNIMVHAGRISGIVDWAEAGWYPYFWESFVLDRAASMFWKVPGAQEMLRAALLEFFPEGTEFGIHWNVQSDFYY